MLQFLHNVKKYLIQEFVASYFNYTFFMIVLTFGNLITYSASVEDKKVREVAEPVFTGRAS